MSGAGSVSVTFTSSGPRVGIDATFPLGTGWSLNAGFAWEPSNSLSGSGSGTVTVGSTTVVSAGSASTTTTGYDYSGGLRYTLPSQRLFIEGGWRLTHNDLGTFAPAGVNVCPCSFQWSGPYLSVGGTF